MRIHYLFGSRYDFSDKKAMHDLRHRNAVYAIKDKLHENGFSIEFHYCTDDSNQQLDIFPNDIVINLHPQFQSTQAHFLEAQASGATCGVFIDSSDTTEIFDTSHPLHSTVKKADFVLVPTIHHSQLISNLNKRIWVIPPIIETEGCLPSLDLNDVKQDNRSLRISCILESESYQHFIRILPDIIHFSHDILPVEIALISREPTGYRHPISSDTVVSTAKGLAHILTKNSNSLTITEKELTLENINDTLQWSDCLFTFPSDEKIEGNIQIPLMGIHTGNFVFVPAKQTVFSLLQSYGVIPYQNDTLLETLQKTLSAPHEVLKGSMADGRKTIQKHHNTDYVASLFINAIRSEYRYKKSVPTTHSAPKSNFDWGKLATKSQTTNQKQSETV